ncbi:acetylglutamate kinase [Aquirufa rosea]|uniref:Acetylglutamate kinase n=1 Tax=Aquirufa rosea TaxID=2509241 RepID=A0A4Q1C0B0_9BACT|nr:acetylglutamate kinase [Aquirufa rosea]RXK49809.1 acetylglutamate kinase [Aquirufa rosea]
MSAALPKLQVIKIGGNVIDNPPLLEAFLTDISKIKSPFVLVHGGGKIATEMAKELGIQSQMIEGRRVTDTASLKIVTMVYAGWINKSITATLQSKQKNALGLTGADAALVLSKKRKPHPIDYGWVGDIEQVNGKALHELVQQGYYPVFAPITADKQGQLLNTNADTMAQAIAIGLSEFYEVTLTYCFEKNGVLSNPEDDNSVIPHIHEASFLQLKEQGIVTAGMIPKLENAIKAISQGVNTVRLCHASQVLLNEGGTKITA